MILLAPASAGVASGMPSGKMILPPSRAARERRPESSTSKLALGSHQPPMPCLGVASDAKGERGVRYSLRKIWVTLSLKKGVRFTVSNFSLADNFLFQS